MNLHDRCIDHGIFHVRITGQGLENPFENIGIAPVAEATKGRAPVAERGGQITPWTARSDNPQHRFHEKTVVATASARIGRFAKAMRFNQRPLGVCLLSGMEK
ncbi:hypothetical protein BGC31_16675 [Komagataeibacter xylinus]|nr:hypothetical protein BFX83_02400 [Komagataeibacter xylinus]RFP00750.1 hypothetical protein BGC31_16675 [Komagataeibacter xylinus]